VRSSGLWLGPALAVVCGIIASGRFTWNVRGLLLGGLVIFLIDGIWATVWAAAVETNWAAIIARWDSSPPPLRPYALPYTRPGAPADHMAHWLAHLAHWWKTELYPVAGTAVSSIALCAALGIALAAILGWQMLVLSAAALAVVQLALVLNRASGQPVHALKAFLEVGLAWLAGHSAFGPLSVISTVMAALFAIAYTGGLQLVEEYNGLPNWRWPQLAAGLILLVIRQPVAALLLFIIVFAQLLLEPALKQKGPAWFVQSSQVWLIAAMLIAAFTIS
jgi:hypothetical protein